MTASDTATYLQRQENSNSLHVLAETILANIEPDGNLKKSNSDEETKVEDDNMDQSAETRLPSMTFSLKNQAEEISPFNEADSQKMGSSYNSPQHMNAIFLPPISSLFKNSQWTHSRAYSSVAKNSFHDRTHQTNERNQLTYENSPKEAFFNERHGIDQSALKTTSSGLEWHHQDSNFRTKNQLKLHNSHMPLPLNFQSQHVYPRNRPGYLSLPTPFNNFSDTMTSPNQPFSCSNLYDRHDSNNGVLPFTSSSESMLPSRQAPYARAYEHDSYTLAQPYLKYGPSNEYYRRPQPNYRPPYQSDTKISPIQMEYTNRSVSTDNSKPVAFSSEHASREGLLNGSSPHHHFQKTNSFSTVSTSILSPNTIVEDENGRNDRKRRFTSNSSDTKMGDAKPKKSKRSTKDPGAPKHPMSPFLFYLTHVRPEYTLKYPGMTLGPISKLISQAWKEISVEERAIHEKKASLDKARYAREMGEFLSKKHGEQIASAKHNQTYNKKNNSGFHHFKYGM